MSNCRKWSVTRPCSECELIIHQNGGKTTSWLKQSSLVSVRISTGNESLTQRSQFFRRKLVPDFLDLRSRKLVAALVVRMTGVSFKPIPGDAVPGGNVIQLAPQVIVLDGLALGSSPVVRLPNPQPSGNALAQVLGVGEKGYYAGLLKGR